jgi:2-polyprenyl-6-methoxyphenol hydroxylase-like FAD-dependent oxidoreductase
MKILISGAGPAGLVVAYWLKRYGFTPTLIEKTPALRTGGYNIDIRGAATEVTRRMGIYEQLANASTDIQSALLIDKEGKVIRKISHNILRHQTGDDIEIMRGKLCQVLMDQLSEIEIIFDDSIENISQTTHAVQVGFKKNVGREFDLVIGADGLHSKVRSLVFGNESQFLHDFGIYYCIFTIPNDLNLDRVEMQYTEFGKMMAIWSTRGDTKATVSFGFVASNASKPQTVAERKQLIRSVFKEMGGEVPRILEMMNEASDFYFDVTGQIKMDSWSSNRVVLLGDSAYCPSPSSGQGLSLAIVGAYILASELTVSKEDFTTAFRNYEQEMRSFVDVNQTLGIKSAKLFKLQENQNLLTSILVKLLTKLPGRMLELISLLSTKNVRRAANAITLKDYIDI